MTEAETGEPYGENPTRSGPNWSDPSVAVGNSPPVSGWPLAISLLAWTGGIVFLLVMMADRLG